MVVSGAAYQGRKPCDKAMPTASDASHNVDYVTSKAPPQISTLTVLIFLAFHLLLWLEGCRLVALRRGYVEYRGLFAWHLRSRGRSEATVRAYDAVVGRYLRVAEDAGAGDPARDDPVRRYLRARAARLAPASMQIEISALRAFFAYLHQVDPLAWQPSGWPRMRRQPKKLVRALSDAEVGVLLAAPDLSTFVGLRDHFVMATLYQCGLRASELAALTIGDVGVDGFLLVRGKGNKERLVPYGGSWRPLYERYLAARRGAGARRSRALLVTRHGAPLVGGRAVWRIVSRYARRALGLSCGFARLEAHAQGRPWTGHYPHLLRAAFATELLNRGMDIFAIGQLLGHEDASTTAQYLAVDVVQLREAASRHPRARRVPPAH